MIYLQSPNEQQVAIIENLLTTYILKTKKYLRNILVKTSLFVWKEINLFQKTEKVLRSNQIFNQNVSFKYVYCHCIFKLMTDLLWYFELWTFLQFYEHYHILRKRKGYYIVAHEKNGHYKTVTNTWES